MDKFQSKNENENQDQEQIKPKCDLRFVFPIQKQKQPFETLLPNTSPEIVDLIKKMITYDPEDRITANDALCHPAFKFLYSLDMEWQKTNRSIPFSIFVTKARNYSNLQQLQPVEQQPTHSILSPSDVSNEPNISNQNSFSNSMLLFSIFRVLLCIFDRGFSNFGIIILDKLDLLFAIHSTSFLSSSFT